MERDDNDYKLGKDVTEKFRGVKKESVVLSVRMSTDEMKHLEALCKETGKTVAQVVRESVANYQPVNPQREAVLTIVNSVGVSSVPALHSQLKWRVSWIPRSQSSVLRGWHRKKPEARVWPTGFHRI